MRKTTLIGVAAGYGARDPGCADGPEALRRSGFLRDLEAAGDDFHWEAPIRLPDPAPGDALAAVAEVNRRLAARVAAVMARGDFPLVIGGDHTAAIGTWSGVRSRLAPAQRLGLVWLDAHMDSHTFRTTPSRALHGMPLACLLGHGEAPLTGLAGPAPKLQPEDVCLIGVRSFEQGEAALLRSLGVRIHFMAEVRERGLAAVLREAVAQVTARTAGYGISLDLDVLDPDEEPGTGTPVPGGLHRRELAAGLRGLHADPRLLGLEIVEYNPHRDRGGETARAIAELCRSIVA